jgi:hypothetical protein
LKKLKCTCRDNKRWQHLRSQSVLVRSILRTRSCGRKTKMKYVLRKVTISSVARYRPAQFRLAFFQKHLQWFHSSSSPTSIFDQLGSGICQLALLSFASGFQPIFSSNVLFWAWNCHVTGFAANALKGVCSERERD